jgi:hypothetical protein
MSKQRERSRWKKPAKSRERAEKGRHILLDNRMANGYKKGNPGSQSRVECYPSLEVNVSVPDLSAAHAMRPGPPWHLPARFVSEIIFSSSFSLAP